VEISDVCLPSKADMQAPASMSALCQNRDLVAIWKEWRLTFATEMDCLQKKKAINTSEGWKRKGACFF
jgi:hypothetical protein